MNARILKLAEQAWDATAVSPDFGHPVSFAEKLAELIVQECAILVENAVLHREPASTYANKIRATFGVGDNHES